jgi:hypothetical protein
MEGEDGDGEEKMMGGIERMTRRKIQYGGGIKLGGKSTHVLFGGW